MKFQINMFKQIIPVSNFFYRLVLSSVSDYFAAMFTSDVCEAKQEEIKMEGIDPNALWDLVQFAYTGIVMHRLYTSYRGKC